MPTSQYGRNPSFGKRLQAIRQARGLSRIALAQAVGMTASDLRSIEGGGRVSHRLMSDLARALYCTARELGDIDGPLPKATVRPGGARSRPLLNPRGTDE